MWLQGICPRVVAATSILPLDRPIAADEGSRRATGNPESRANGFRDRNTFEVRGDPSPPRARSAEMMNFVLLLVAIAFEMTATGLLAGAAGRS
jgi:hypothetical protein